VSCTSGSSVRSPTRHAGIASYQYHLARRVDRAQVLLAQTDLPLQDIAATLQFDDAYHFSKTHKARTGSCPSDWRRA
jgi:transcriptional regulator GlxA family with amidase domain